jgi:DNA-binding MarR family transcriptional regulator
MPKSRSRLSLSELLCFDLYASSRAVTRAYGPLLATLGLTYPQYLVMIALWEKQPLSVKDLAERLSLDSGTLSPLLKRLQAARLVRRERSAEDERAVIVSLTDKGDALRSQARVACDAIGQAFGMTAEEVRKLQTVLRRIQTRMS